MSRYRLPDYSRLTEKDREIIDDAWNKPWEDICNRKEECETEYAKDYLENLMHWECYGSEEKY